jgi:hypothetical protein
MLDPALIEFQKEPTETMWWAPVQTVELILRFAERRIGNQGYYVARRSSAILPGGRKANERLLY